MLCFRVQVLAEYPLTAEEKAVQGRDKVAVAVRKGPLLATAFHPEITTDTRWHQLFVQMVRQAAVAEAEKAAAAGVVPLCEQLGRAPNRPADLPIYGQEFMKREDIAV